MQLYRMASKGKIKGIIIGIAYIYKIQEYNSMLQVESKVVWRTK